MNWTIKRFDELTTRELFEIYKVRAEVFVVEQECLYQDVDEKDLVAYHLFTKEDEDIKAYCRVFLEKEKVKIGRVLVRKKYRKEGLGRELMNIALDFINETFQDMEIFIQAQAYLERFYESLGFVRISEDYLDVGILHLDMKYES